MAKKAAKVEVVGLEEMKDVFDELLPKHAANLSRALVHSLAGQVAEGAKQLAPSDTGTLKGSIKAKRRRSKPESPVSDVVIDKSKNKAWYWFFIEYGTGGKNPFPERPFLRPALDVVQADMKNIIKEQFTKKLKAMVRREQKKANKK